MNEDDGKSEDSRETSFEDLFDRTIPYLKNLWANRYRIVFANALADLIVLSYLLFFTEPYYVSTITILPEYGKSGGGMGLGGLASLAGVTSEGAPTTIYNIILRSESVLGNVIFARYLSPKFRDSVNLIQYFDLEAKTNENPEVQRRKQFLGAYDLLRTSIMATKLDNQTGVLDITITMPESKLSAEVANNVVQSLDLYIKKVRKSNALNKRLYLEQRNSQVEDSLRNSEEELKIFRTQNRVTGQSPSLLLEESRLRRKVELYQAIYVQINQQLELARIDEIKDTPIINLKEKVQDPIVKTGPKRKDTFIVAVFLMGLSIVLYYAFRDKTMQFFIMLKTKFRG